MSKQIQSMRWQRGQGTSEYVMMFVGVVVLAIAAYGVYGQVVRSQVGDMATALAHNPLMDMFNEGTSTSTTGTPIKAVVTPPLQGGPLSFTPVEDVVLPPTPSGTTSNQPTYTITSDDVVIPNDTTTTTPPPAGITPTQVSFAQSAFVLTSTTGYQYNGQTIKVPSSFSTAEQSGPLTSQEVQAMAQQLVTVFESKGLSLDQAIGVVGSLYEESGLNPSIVQGGSYSSNPNAAGSTVNQDGYGLAQWGNDGGSGRLPGLEAFAAQNNLPPSSAAAQVGYILYEISGPYSSVISSIASGPTTGLAAAENAVSIWTTQYEEASSPEISLRNTDASTVAGLVGVSY